MTDRTGRSVSAGPAASHLGQGQHIGGYSWHVGLLSVSRYNRTAVRLFRSSLDAGRAGKPPLLTCGDAAGRRHDTERREELEADLFEGGGRVGRFVRNLEYVQKWLLLGCDHRRDSRTWCGRVLPDDALHRQFLAGLCRGLSHAHREGGRRQRRVPALRQGLGASAGDDGRRAGVVVDRCQIRSGSQRPRHRQRDRGNPHRSASYPAQGRARQNGFQCLDHRLGWVRRARRSYCADLGGLRVDADAPASPLGR